MQRRSRDLRLFLMCDQPFAGLAQLKASAVAAEREVGVHVFGHLSPAQCRVVRC